MSFEKYPILDQPLLKTSFFRLKGGQKRKISMIFYTIHTHTPSFFIFNKNVNLPTVKFASEV